MSFPRYIRIKVDTKESYNFESNYNLITYHYIMHVCRNYTLSAVKGYKLALAWVES